MTKTSSLAGIRPGSFGNRRVRVGILGGSFNPAHTGHLHISRQALKLLKLDEIWWLVSPQNPLKPVQGMASMDQRLKSARSMARGRHFRVTDMERDLGTQFTADTLKALKAKFSKTRFVWIMGADNLIDIARWNDWMEIFETVPVAVFGRPAYSFRALFSKAARRFARNRLNESRAALLVDKKPPAWVFLHIPLSTVSATRIRGGG